MNFLTRYIFIPIAFFLLLGFGSDVRAGVTNSGSVRCIAAENCAGYWNFDEGTGTLAKDMSGNGNDGTLTNGPTWVNGKSSRFKNALNFNGTNAYVAVSSSPVSNTSSGFTLSAWINVTTFAQANVNINRRILHDAIDSNTSFQMTLNASGGGQNVFTFVVYKSGVETTRYTTNTWSTGTWYFVTMVWDGSAQKIYINGTSQALTSDSGFGNGTVDNKLYIGQRSDNVGNFSGSLDDVRIYNRALSAGEIQTLYNATAPSKIITTSSSAPCSSAVTGLMGCWQFDEGQGGTTKDASGNGNTGTLNTTGANALPLWIKGPLPGFKNALSFDGVRARVDVPNASSLNPAQITLAMWVKRNGNQGNFVRLIDKNCGGGAYQMYFYALTNDLGGFLSGIITDTDSGWLIPDGIWAHVAMTYNGASVNFYGNGVLRKTVAATGAIPTNDTGQFSIFNSCTADNEAKGSADEVRIYNRALSDYEIKRLYNATAPSRIVVSKQSLRNGLVGYWNFDEPLTTTSLLAKDKSGNKNTGTLVSSPTRVAGKATPYGNALSFNGTNTYVRVLDNAALDGLATTFTVAAWVKRTGNLVEQEIYQSGTQSNFWQFIIGNNNKMDLAIRFVTDNYANTALDTNWHHVAVVKNGNSGTNITFYLDGTADGNGSATIGSVTTPSGPKYIGMRDAGTDLPLNATLDDLRLYNRALSATEIKALYNLRNPSGPQ